ncbi:MAG TPA: DNA repair exonuclease [Candidatus Limnocylindrales bacterium]|nr:DNA repair exonuclease [Candidatus Limnocylindrales bacterium]
MLRLLHTADVHLGARHADLGEGAAAQRERQYAAFRATLDLAIAEKLDLVLIAGDLFDSNVQPKRSVERVAADLARLKAAKVRTVILPGTHDVYDRASIYRAYDLKALAGSGVHEDWITVLTPDAPFVHLAACGVIVVGVVHDTKRAPRGALADALAKVPAEVDAPWRIGMLHGALAIPGRTDGDEVVVTTDEIAASGLDYLALGHWHSMQEGTAGSTTWAYSGAPEPVAVDQDKAGNVLLVTLDDSKGPHLVTVEPRTVGRTTFRALELDARDVVSQPALVQRLVAEADPDLVLDVRLGGVRPDELDLDPAEVEAELRDRFLRARVRDRSVPALTEGALPPPDTIAGAFIRNLEARVAEIEAARPADETNGTGDSGAVADDARAAELRDALRLGRLLLAGHEVTL